MEYAKEFAVSYSDEVAFKGRFLVEILDQLVIDYAYRRAELPESSSEVFDGLWTVAASWINCDDNVDPALPGSFIYGLDPERNRTSALWRGSDGVLYSFAREWDPWPSGWKRVPKPSDMEELHKNGIFGDMADPPKEDELPSVIIWQCWLNK